MNTIYDENNSADKIANLSETLVVDESHETNLAILVSVLIEKISELDANALYEFMEIHSKLAVEVYKRSVELGILNEQEFINWQDELNAVSYVHTTDLN